MYIVTFYSYKGGVGRTLALANVAASLSRRGRTVLLVDFDLEAPGLSSFEFQKGMTPDKNKKGVVDFVHHYIQAGTTPSIENYLTRYPADSEDTGDIWLMSAGRVDSEYSSKLATINWSDLYADVHGFLLMEDLKAQWKNFCNPDYVLIDSRTGHTDIGGICTRQLPDLVTFVFWPNVQNRVGLSSVVKNIVEEESDTERKIAQLFVPCNLPTLDDENGVVKKSLEGFRKELGYTIDQEIIIHNYQSLDLLTQQIFTTTRPNSQMAKEYRSLTDAIQMHNEEDELGVRLLLSNDVEEPSLKKLSPKRRGTIADKLVRLAEREWKDPQIYRLLAYHLRSEGELEEALNQYNNLIRLNQDQLQDHQRRADLMLALRDFRDADTTIIRLMEDELAGTRQYAIAIRLLNEVRSPSERVSRAVYSTKIKTKNLISIASREQRTRQSARLLARVILDREDLKKEELRGDEDLMLTFIAAGRFKEAIEISPVYGNVEDSRTKQRLMFNLAVAEWGFTSVVPSRMFEQIIELGRHDKGANYDQCLALSAAAIGRNELAQEHLSIARSEIEKIPGSFSCWRYLRCSRREFLDDLKHLENWMSTGSPTPEVFAQDDQELDLAGGGRA